MTTQRFLRLFLLSGVAFCLLLGGNPTARATSVMKLTDEGLVKLAGVILEGRVTRTQSEWNPDRTQIHTVVTISVRTIMKGTLPDTRTLTLRLLGGRVGDTVMEMVSAPVFKEGEEVILFLRDDIRALLPVVGLHQGKLSIETDKNTGRKTVTGRGLPPDEFMGKLQKIIEDQAQ